MTTSLRTAAALLVLVFTGVAVAQVTPCGYYDSTPGSVPATFAGSDFGQPLPAGSGLVPSAAGYRAVPNAYGNAPMAYNMVSSQLPSAAVPTEAYPAPVQPLRSDACQQRGAGSCSADPAGCACNWTDCESQWNFAVDAMILGRIAGSSYPFIRVLPASGNLGDLANVCQDTSDFRYNWQFGYRISASYMTECGWGAEFGFFGIADGWKYNSESIGPYQFHGGGFIVDPPPGGNSDFQVCDHTQMYSTQLNATHGVCDWATMRVGLRWLWIEDTLSVFEAGRNVGLYDANVTNNLIGPQVGADFLLMDLCCSRFRIYATTNVGLLYNYIALDQSSQWMGKADRATAPELSLMGELALTAKWRISDHWAVRGGYYALALNNVGLAADQMAADDMNQFYAQLRQGSFIAHGAFAGFEVFW